MSRRRVLGIAAATVCFGLVGLAVWGLRTRPTPDLGAPPLPEVSDPEAWVADKVAEGEALGVWPQARQRLVRTQPGRTPVAFLYIHGFGASRAEGEQVVDTLAEDWQANALYLRLPGHGIDAEAHARATPEAYAGAVADALGVMPTLGEKVVVVGGSTGGLLATWAAATWPDRVDAVVLASPFYAFVDPLAQHLLPRTIALDLLHALYGEDRFAGWSEDPEGRKVEGYEDHWLIDQKYRALIALEDTRRAIATDETFAAVQAPVLLLHYFKDEAHQDGVVAVPAMRAAFAAMNGGAPHPASELVAIADGNHILTSGYVRTDKEAVLAACRRFLGAAVGPPPPPTPPAGDGARTDAGPPNP